jgi:hypothetical protein
MTSFKVQGSNLLRSVGVSLASFLLISHRFRELGFEYWADPSNRDTNFITWQSNGMPTSTLSASAMGPDPDGTGVSQRLISEEPMAIILNLAISRMFPTFHTRLVFAHRRSAANWQTITLPSMEFPAYMLIDYVRVYQRSGQINIGCDPVDYPTANYINAHLSDYTSKDCEHDSVEIN